MAEDQAPTFTDLTVLAKQKTFSIKEAEKFGFKLNKRVIEQWSGIDKNKLLYTDSLHYSVDGNGVTLILTSNYWRQNLSFEDGINETIDYNKFKIKSITIHITKNYSTKKPFLGKTLPGFSENTTSAQVRAKFGHPEFEERSTELNLNSKLIYACLADQDVNFNFLFFANKLTDIEIIPPPGGTVIKPTKNK